MFVREFTLQELLAQGNPLPKLEEMIDFELFRNILEPVFELADRKIDAGQKPLELAFFSTLRCRNGQWQFFHVQGTVPTATLRLELHAAGAPNQG